MELRYGVGNRRHADRFVQHQIDLAKRNDSGGALALADVDHFKRYNDRFGHPAGDSALRALAMTMRATLRHLDIAARYGGEEFVVLMSGVQKGMAPELAQTFRRNMAETCLSFESKTIKTTVSLGVAEMVPKATKLPILGLNMKSKGLFSKVN